MRGIPGPYPERDHSNERVAERIGSGVAGEHTTGGRMRERVYESALNDVRYTYGRPLKFIAGLPKDPRSDDPEVWHRNAERAALAQLR